MALIDFEIMGKYLGSGDGTNLVETYKLLAF